MSVIIKGMGMPKSCDSCDLIQFDDEELEAHCPLSPHYRWCGTPPDYRPEGCPLVEVPTPHGRLIDCERATFPTAFRYNTNDYAKGWNACIKAVQTAPTIIEAEESK